MLAIILQLFMIRLFRVPVALFLCRQRACCHRRGMPLHHLPRHGDAAFAGRGCASNLSFRKQILDFAWSHESLVNCERGRELHVLASFDGIKQLQSVSLAVVRDEIVPWLRFPDGLNDMLA